MVEKGDITIGGYPANPSSRNSSKYSELFEVIAGLPIVNDSDMTDGWASLVCEDAFAATRIRAAIYQFSHRNRENVNYVIQISTRKNKLILGVILWFRKVHKLSTE